MLLQRYPGPSLLRLLRLSKTAKTATPTTASPPKKMMTEATSPTTHRPRETTTRRPGMSSQGRVTADSRPAKPTFGRDAATAPHLEELLTVADVSRILQLKPSTIRAY